jgi:hypothetical protein
MRVRTLIFLLSIQYKKELILNNFNKNLRNLSVYTLFEDENILIFSIRGLALA